MKLRIDFRVQEVTEDENPRGISFGDEVSLEGMLDFFDRCRDAAKTLFIGNKESAEIRMRKEVKEQLERQRENELLEKRKRTEERRLSVSQSWARQACAPWDDGSRGGEGPSYAEIERLKNKNTREF